MYGLRVARTWSYRRITTYYIIIWKKNPNFLTNELMRSRLPAGTALHPSTDNCTADSSWTNVQGRRPRGDNSFGHKGSYLKSDTLRHWAILADSRADGTGNWSHSALAPMLSSYGGGAWYRVVIIKTPKKPSSAGFIPACISSTPHIPDVCRLLSHLYISAFPWHGHCLHPNAWARWRNRGLRQELIQPPHPSVQPACISPLGSVNCPLQEPFHPQGPQGKLNTLRDGYSFSGVAEQTQGYGDNMRKRNQQSLKISQKISQTEFFVLLPHTLAGLPCY